jgi:multidrug efflux pump
MGAVQLSPGANAIETVKAVKARAAELEANFPDDIQISFPYDTSKFVSAAIEKVIYTLVEAIVLVFLVMLLFLQNLRYTLIPTIVVPVYLGHLCGDVFDGLLGEHDDHVRYGACHWYFGG